MGAMAVLLVFLGGAEASASPPFALPMFITIKKIIILHLFLGVPAATVGGTGTPVATPLLETLSPDAEKNTPLSSRTEFFKGFQSFALCK